MKTTTWILLAIALLAGCTRPAPTPKEDGPEVPIPEEGDRFEQSFEKACARTGGDDQLPPGDRTIAGKSTATLRQAIEKEWSSIRLVDSAGAHLPWTVQLETEQGTIEIMLRPALAPNHVRNLIALCKVGYYDGLRFDRIVRQEATEPDGTVSRIELVRFGCPLGTGDPGVGHLGYHLRSEFSDAKHEVGTVGFERDSDPSSAGVRLYIALKPAPIRDSNYTIVGTVIKGMDVVEKIAAGRLVPPDADPSRELPERPVTIRKATARH